MNWDQLCRPFNRSQFKTRKGKSNQQYLYIPSETIVARILECTKDWDFIIKDHWKENDEVIVVGSLRIEGFGVREAFGSGTFNEKNGYGNAYKTAQSLCLVKAASFWGIPCIHHTKNDHPQQQELKPEVTPGKDLVCEDCNEEVDLKTYNYSRYNFQGHIYCRQCQPKHRNNMRSG